MSRYDTAAVIFNIGESIFATTRCTVATVMRVVMSSI